MTVDSKVQSEPWRDTVTVIVWKKESIFRDRMYRGACYC
jgi:hypothetical protein